MTFTPTMNFRWLRRVVTITAQDGQARVQEETVLQQQFQQIDGRSNAEWRDVPTTTVP